MVWLNRFFRSRRQPSGSPPAKRGMPYEAIVTDEALVRAWWEWSRLQRADPGAEPDDAFVIWILRKVIPFSIRLAREPEGSIEEWSPELYLSISFGTEGDLARFHSRWGVGT